jgi:hypothetical protein
MAVLITLVAVAFLTLLLAFWAFRSSPAIQNFSELEKHARPVDLRCLANLVDPAQERFLKFRLSKRELLQFKIMRFRAANGYIVCTAHNAGLLLSIGRAAARNSSLEIATAGRELAEAAIRVRMYALLARASLAVQILFPSPFKSLTLLMRDYDRIQAQVARLSMLESSSPAALRYP